MALSINTLRKRKLTEAEDTSYNGSAFAQRTSGGYRGKKYTPKEFRAALAQLVDAESSGKASLVSDLITKLGAAYSELHGAQ